MGGRDRAGAEDVEPWRRAGSGDAGWEACHLRFIEDLGFCPQGMGLGSGRELANTAGHTAGVLRLR